MEVSATDIRRAAMDLLARREHGFNELTEKLLIRFRKSEKKASKDSSASTGMSSGLGMNDLLAEESAENGADAADNEPLVPLRERIEIEVQKLTSQGLQNDARLAEAFVRARANRGQGPMKIKSELRQKGISDHIITTAMEESEQDWFSLAAEVSAKKFRGFSEDPQQRAKEKAKRSRFLQQRGFSFDHISAVDHV